MTQPAARAAAGSRPARGGQLRARYVAVDAERVLAPGLIEWDARGRIVSLRRARGPVADVAVLPGLVNAHAHLQIAALETSAKAQPERRFLPWIDRVMAAGRLLTPAVNRRAARLAAQQVLESGATAIGEIDSTGESPAALAELPIAGRCYRELTGFQLQRREARAMVRQRWPAAGSMAPGLSPHAPYSVSPELLRAAAARTAHLAIHCAEVPEEQHFLRTGRGPFADLLHRLGRLPEHHRAPGCGAVQWLQRLGVLRRSTLLVHCQELERGDVARIVAAGASIVVCPGTIDYFRRSPPPVPRWLQAGIAVGIGTDSLASNEALSMRAELARAQEMWPELSPTQVLAMATSGGARALGGAFGVLRRGRRADFVMVPAAATWLETEASFVQGTLPIESIVLAGVTYRS